MLLDRDPRRIRRASFLLFGWLAAAGLVDARFDRTDFMVSASVPAVCEVRAGGRQAPVNIRCTHGAFAAVTLSPAPDRTAQSDLQADPMQPVGYVQPETGRDECEFIVVARGFESAVQLVSSACSWEHPPESSRDGHATALFRF